MSEWTAYAFTLDEIERAVDGAIWEGTPSGPAVLRLRRGIPDGLGGYEPDKFALVTVPTRWTQAYRGRRDLGVGVPVRVRPEYAAELDALVALVDAGLIEMRHVGDGWCSCRGTAVITAACARLTTGESREVKRETVRSRQREANAAFQRSHVQRRAVGLERRQARKLSLPKRQDGAAQA